MFTGIRKVALTGILAALAGGQAWAVTPISVCNPSAAAPAGSLITAPGNYVLTADLTCLGSGGNGDAIDITASNVSVNLNGHIINGCPLATCPSAPVGNGIVVSSPGGSPRLNHVGISGPGLIRGFSDGIFIQFADYVQVSATTLAGNGVVGILASNVTYLSAAANVIVGGGNAGLFLQDSTAAQVTGNQVMTGSPGIWVFSGDSNSLSGNGANGNSGSGILMGPGTAAFPLTNSRVSSNTTNGNGGSGIEVLPLLSASSGNKIFNNLSSVGNVGFDLQDDNLAPPCGSDFWSGNVHFTQNLACVK